MKWSILICTLGQRGERFLSLLDSLMPQVRKYEGEIEVVAYWNNAERPLAEIRQALVESAHGEYISFVDDDDELPSYYCDEVMKALKSNPDYVGWRMQAYHNGEKLKPTYHSLRYEMWDEDDDGYYRDVSHLNPVKRDLALKVSFVHETENPEDYRWAAVVKPFLKTEEYIDKVMYHYKHTTDDSTWRGDINKQLKWVRPDVKRKYFRYCR